MELTELTQEQIKTGIKNQMQEFLSKLYIDFDQKQDYVMEPGTVNLFVADSVTFEIALKELLKVSQPASSEITTIKVSGVDNNGGKKVEEAKIFLKESLAKVGEEISLLIDIIRVNEKHIPFDHNSTLKDNSMFTFKDNGMTTLGNSLEGETPKIKNSTFSDSFGDM